MLYAAWLHGACFSEARAVKKEKQMILILAADTVTDDQSRVVVVA